MKRLLYPMIASALITIVPFLLTFEKGQDIVRGLFGYEYFALLLLITFIKSKQARISFANKKKIPVYTGMTIVLICPSSHFSQQLGLTYRICSL